MILVVIPTGVVFVKYKALALIAFLAISILFSSVPSYAASETSSYCLPITANAHIVCNAGYTEVNGSCLSNADVKGSFASRSQIPDFLGIFLFIAGTSVGTWFLVHNRTQNTLW